MTKGKPIGASPVLTGDSETQEVSIPIRSFRMTEMKRVLMALGTEATMVLQYTGLGAFLCWFLGSRGNPTP